MQIAAGPAIGARCPLDHDRQRALFSKFFFSKVFQVLAIAAPDLEFFPLRCGTSSVRWARADRALFPLSRRDAPGESRCLRCRRAAVPSMLRDYEQFPTTEGNVEARRRGPPGPRAALSASIADLGPMPFPRAVDEQPFRRCCATMNSFRPQAATSRSTAAVDRGRVLHSRRASRRRSVVYCGRHGGVASGL